MVIIALENSHCACACIDLWRKLEQSAKWIITIDLCFFSALKQFINISSTNNYKNCQNLLLKSDFRAREQERDKVPNLEHINILCESDKKTKFQITIQHRNFMQNAVIYSRAREHTVCWCYFNWWSHSKQL